MDSNSCITPVLPPTKHDMDCRPLPEMPYEVIRLIRDLATYDTSWDEYPPPVVGYRGSPLCAAMSISQVCTEWRADILADEALWGRLLNTIYFPTCDNVLWNLVYRRSGDKPVWLRYLDRTPPELSMYRLSERRMYAFKEMFLTLISDISPDRIQRLELDAWHAELLLKVPWEVEMKITKAIERHTTHLTLGNSFYAAALEMAAGVPKNTYLAQHCLRRGMFLSVQIRRLVFGGHMRRGQVRPLRQLRIYALALDVEDVLSILRTSLNLEELELWIGADRGHYGRTISPPGAEPVVLLPHLRTLSMESSPAMGLESVASYIAGADEANAAFHFDIRGKFSMYYCRRARGLYTFQCVPVLDPK